MTLLSDVKYLRLDKRLWKSKSLLTKPDLAVASHLAVMDRQPVVDEIVGEVGKNRHAVDDFRNSFVICFLELDDDEIVVIK